MKKIALVNHRYGLEIASGSEVLCRLIAERLLLANNDVEVLTTCAFDETTWANYYPEGKQIIGKVPVRRFPVEKKRNWANYNALNDYINAEGNHRFEDEVQWVIDQGPYSPYLFDFIHQNYDRYDAIIFMTYLYYTSAICILGIPNAIFMPTGHDEAAIRLPFYKMTFSSPEAYIYNTIEEKEFLENLFPSLKQKSSFVGAFGIDIPTEIQEVHHLKIDYPYILYAGRITPAKGCDELINYFLEYKKQSNNNLKLVLIGKNEMVLPNSEDICYLGFVDEDVKQYLMKNAKLFVIASHFESLSIVLLEALSVNTPVLVTTKCSVLMGHVVRSKAGYCFDNFQDFSNALESALMDTEDYKQKKINGSLYVRNNYSWGTVLQSIEKLITQLDFKRSDKPINMSALINADYYKRVIKPAFDERNIPIVLAADDNYVSFLAVTLQSIIDESSSDNNYDIIVLSDGISIINKKMLLKMVNKYNYIGLRFTEVRDYLNDYVFQFTNTRISRATFLRLLIPSLFIEYEKLIYLDCDIVVKHDISDLFNTELEDNMFGAVRDTHVALVWRFRSNIEKHLKENVKLINPIDYFNAGVLVINIKKVTELFDSNELLTLATSRKWLWEDQDVLNLIANGRVKFLDIKWNYFWVSDQPLMTIMKCNLEYDSAMDMPYIIHYAGGTTPVSRSGEFFAEEFWQKARKTPFYEMLIERAYKNLNPKQEIINEIERVCANLYPKKVSKIQVLKNKLLGTINSLQVFGPMVTLQTIGIYVKGYMKYRGNERHTYIHRSVLELRKSCTERNN